MWDDAVRVADWARTALVIWSVRGWRMAGGSGSLKVDVIVVRLGLDGMLDVGREGACLCFL